MVREDRETSGQTMRRQPHLSACRAGCRSAQLSQLRVNSQRAANTLDTLRRALEHSADYAGPAAARPQARTVGGADARRLVPITDSRVFHCASSRDRLRIISALCLGARPKPPVLGDGGLFSTEGNGVPFTRNIIRRSRPAPLPAPRHPRRRAAPRRSRARAAPPPHQERSRAPTATCRAHAPFRDAWRCGSP